MWRIIRSKTFELTLRAARLLAEMPIPIKVSASVNRIERTAIAILIERILEVKSRKVIRWSLVYFQAIRFSDIATRKEGMLRKKPNKNRDSSSIPSR